MVLLGRQVRIYNCEKRKKISICVYTTMQKICCDGDKNNSPRSSFRDRLPDNIKKLTVDVISANTETKPKLYTYLTKLCSIRRCAD